MNRFEIFNQTEEEIEYLSTIESLIKYTLEHEKLDDVIFNIIIVNNEKIKEINKEYRNIDAPTDVISFALEDIEDIKLPFGRVLGDIYISIDKVKSQAVEYGHTELREFAFLTVHGILHLLGYDHMNKEDEEIMFSRQELILNEYGITR